MLPVSLDCVVFLFCLSSSCVPYVASFSGLCCVFVLFVVVLCTLCCQVLWIVLCVCFVCLRLVYPMLPVFLDCPFLIAPSVFSNVYLLNTRNILILDSEVIGLSMNTQEGIILHTDTRTGRAVNIVSE